MSSNKNFFANELKRLYQGVLYTPEQYAQVRRSKTYMESHFCESIQLDVLAEQAYMSRFHYVRVFQQMYGLTPRVYLRDMRINKAKQLLLQGTSVTQVCFAVGYESLPTFSSVFKRSTGQTPKEYQKLNKSNPE